MFIPVGISEQVRKVKMRLLLLALFTASPVLATAEAAESGGWVMASFEGAVSIDGQAAGMPVSPVGPGTVIETGADGNAVLTRAGDSITVYPNSRMSVPAAGDGEEPGIMQTLGRLLFRMESRESRDFEVKTPYLAAAIKGTTFTVAVNADEAEVSVSEGLVLVSANRSGQSAYVATGQSAAVSRDNGDMVRLSRRGGERRARDLGGDSDRDDDSGDDAHSDDDGSAPSGSDDSSQSEDGAVSDN